MAKFAKATKKAWKAKVLLFGDSAVGKTHASLTFPKPAVIDAEGSADLFVDRFDFQVSATKSVSEARSLVDDIKAGRVECDTIVIDSLTSFYNTLLNAASIGKDDGTMLPADWGKVKRTFSRLIDELYYKLDKHVVCTAWSKPEYAKKGDVVNGRDVGANEMIKLRDMPDCDKKVEHAFNLVFRMENVNGKRFATCTKSQYKAIKQGDRFPDFSWSTLKDLFDSYAGAADTTGETEEDAAVRDQAELERQPARSKARTVQQAGTVGAAVPLKSILDKWVQAGQNPEDLAAWVNDQFPDAIYIEGDKRKSKLSPEQTHVIWGKVVAMCKLHLENLAASAEEPPEVAEPVKEPQGQPDEAPAQTAGGSNGEPALGLDAQMVAAGLEADDRPALDF